MNYEELFDKEAEMIVLDSNLPDECLETQYDDIKFCSNRQNDGGMCKQCANSKKVIDKPTNSNFIPLWV